MNEKKYYAVVDTLNGESLILNYHQNSCCIRIESEESDIETEKLRATIRFPDKLSKILMGTYEAPKGIKSLIELEITNEEQVFKDSHGNLHRIAPCQSCVSN